MAYEQDNSKATEMWRAVLRRTLRAVVPVEESSESFAELLRKLDGKQN
jgi:uncharacterized protein (DUF2267 family)